MSRGHDSGDFQREKGSVMRYKVVLQKSEEGYSVSCPGLPGCWSQGATEADALENIQDAIREYLAAVDDLLHGTPDAEVREVEVVV
jgi:predicted RNase H-like HicB family nuclease